MTAFPYPEMQIDAACPSCGSRAVVTAVAPRGERERPVFLRCYGCGRERDDVEFYEEPGHAAA